MTTIPSQAGHLRLDLEHLPVFEPVDQLPGVGDHDRRVGRKVRVMKGGLDQFSLLLPERAVAGQQSLSCKRPERVLEQTRLVKSFGMLDQDLTRQVGMVHLIHVQRAEMVVREIAIPPRDVETEGQRIERDGPGQHLAQDGEQQMNAGTWGSRRHAVRLCRSSPG
ncbi:MAG TPA: hypothetical protein VKE96_06370 [Vicinamibacterales bacterium]|nr:hypothetical protein [Vicinamibacterales bacterium]